MDEQKRKDLYALCSWVEAYHQKITPAIEDKLDELQDQIDPENIEAQKNFFPELQKQCEDRLLNLLSIPVPEPMVGFAFGIAQQKRQSLLNEVIAEVSEKGLLKDALHSLDELDMSEEQKVALLLSAAPTLPPLHHLVNASLLLPVQNLKTGKQTHQKLPVRVVVADGQLVDVILPNMMQNEKE